LVRNEYLNCVLAVGKVEEAVRFRQNPILPDTA